MPCNSVSKRVQARNLCYENEFDLHENEPAGGTDFHLNAFALKLVLKQKHKRTRKWPIAAVQPRSQVSHLTALWGERGGGKMRDPGNEVGSSFHGKTNVSEVTFSFNCSCRTQFSVPMPNSPLFFNYLCLGARFFVKVIHRRVVFV